ALQGVVGIDEIVHRGSCHGVVTSDAQGVSRRIGGCLLVQREGDAFDGVFDGVALRLHRNAVDRDAGVFSIDDLAHARVRLRLRAFAFHVVVRQYVFQLADVLAFGTTY